jgi:hypothetical protein
MSLFDDASLAMIPSAYKDGKLYSIKPTDGSGDFTFTRGSNLAATRVDENGLIEKGRENLLLQSSNFSEADWVKSNVTIASGFEGYDGTNDAWELTRTATAYARMNQAVSQSVVYAHSIYAKAGTLNWISIGPSGGGEGTWFNLSDGTIGIEGGLIKHSSIESVGNGWYRISVVLNNPPTQWFRFYPSDVDGGDESATATGTIYIQDAQLELGLVATDYIETTTTTAQAGILEDMPRLDYSGGASCPSLLLEPQRTNLLTHSEYYGGGDWSRTRCGFVTNTSETLSPEGLYNASKMTSTDASESYAQNNVTLGSTSGTFTFFAKKGDLDYCHALVWDISANGRRQWFNLATGAVGTTTNFGGGYTKVDATIEDYGNGWYRCSFSWSGGNTTSGVRINISSGDGVIDSPINSYGYFYGAQCEASVSYPTSYIPTYGTSQTRSDDFMNISSLADEIDGNSFTYFLEINNEAVVRDSATGNISVGASGNRFFLYNDSSATARMKLYIQDVTTQSYQLSADNVKLVVRIEPNKVEVFENGVSVLSTTQNLDFSGNSSYVLRGATREMGIKQTAIFPTPLTDSECIALTTL